MIFETGYLPPTKRQLQLIREHADESFCNTVPAGFGAVPIVPGFEIACPPTPLSLSYVEPHDDPWVGDTRHDDGNLVYGIDGPADRRAIFWLLATAKFNQPIIQVGTMAHRLLLGHWVMFDDRILHSVFSRRKWWGLAYQLRPV